MSFNDLARKEAADKKASLEKDQKSQAAAKQTSVSETKPTEPPAD